MAKGIGGLVGEISGRHPVEDQGPVGRFCVIPGMGARNQAVSQSGGAVRGNRTGVFC